MRITITVVVYFYQTVDYSKIYNLQSQQQQQQQQQGGRQTADWWKQSQTNCDRKTTQS